MKLSEVHFNLRNKKKKRVGRGEGSGHGKTSGKGHKGQNARSGRGVPFGFEGGQTPIYRRLPKRGFHNKFKKIYSIVNLKDLNRFEKDSKITPKDLMNKRLIKNTRNKVKILGNGEVKIPIIISAHMFSESAKKKIEQAGGKIEVINV